MAKIEITLKRSFIGKKDDQIATAKALGLRKIGQSVIKENNNATKGMVHKIIHMIDVKELD